MLRAHRTMCRYDVTQPQAAHWRNQLENSWHLYSVFLWNKSLYGFS